MRERWQLAWQARRDARRRATHPGRPQPYLESLRAQADVGQGAVSHWLGATLAPIDREVLRVLILLDQHGRDPKTPPESIPDAADAAPQPLTGISPRIAKARAAAEAQKTYQRWLSEQYDAEQRLGELGSTRHHVIEVARAAVHAHLARYQRLVGVYHTALFRRDPGRYQAGSPTVVPEVWLYGDVPLLVLEIDGAIAEKYRWRLNEFVSRTSAVTLPVNVTPNLN